MRAERFSGIIDVDVLNKSSAAVIGVGGIGHPLALGLAGMGCPRLFLWDHDSVEEPNLGTQGYKESQLGTLKVDACAEEISEANPSVLVNSMDYEWTPEHRLPRGATVFSMVDNMDVRKEIFETWIELEDRGPFIEARMGAEFGRVHAVSPDNVWAWTDFTWFPQEEAAELPCTSRATSYCGGLAASVALGLWSQWLRGIEMTRCVEFNMLTWGMRGITDLKEIDLNANKPEWDDA